MQKLSPETIEALCDTYELHRLSPCPVKVTAEVKCDSSEVVRIDFANEQDQTSSASVVVFEKSPKKSRRSKD